MEETRPSRKVSVVAAAGAVIAVTLVWNTAFFMKYF